MLTVNEIMTVAPQAVDSQTPIHVVALKMKQEMCRQFPVLDQGQLVGIVTDRDIRAVLNTPLFETGTVENCMTPDPIVVSPDTPAYQAANLLKLYKLGALPVVKDNNLVGLVTVTDFLRHFSDEPLREQNQPLIDDFNGWCLVGI